MAENDQANLFLKSFSILEYIFGLKNLNLLQISIFKIES